MKAIRTQVHLLATVILLLSAGLLYAQSEEQIKQFNQEKQDYFNEKLEMSKSEKEAFWPVYKDFNNRKGRLMEEERNTYRYTNQNAENLSEEEMEQTMKRILELKTRILDLDREYYIGKFPEILGHEKTMELYMAEWEFRRHLIHRLRGRDGSGRGKGRGLGGGPEGGPGTGQVPF